MIDLDRHLDLGSRQLKAHVAAFPTPTFRQPKPASRLRAGLAAAAVTVAVILPVSGLLRSDEPATTGTEATQPTPVDTDFETIVGEFTKAPAVAGFSEPRDFVEGAGLAGFGMVAVGHHTEFDSQPKAWIAPDEGNWSAIDLSLVDLTGVELFLDVKEMDGQLAILALDILEYDGDPASRRLLVVESSDLETWASREITGPDAFALGFTNVTALSVGDAYTLQSVARFGIELVAIGVPAGSDAPTVISSSDGGHTWIPSSAPEVAGLPLEALNAVAASGAGMVAGGGERVVPEGEDSASTQTEEGAGTQTEDTFATQTEDSVGTETTVATSVEETSQAIILWSPDGNTWQRADIELGDSTESWIIDVIAIDGGFLAQGMITDPAGSPSNGMLATGYWTSNDGRLWKRVELPELESRYGRMSYDAGILTVFATPHIGPATDSTGPLEVWQGTIQVSDRPQS
ncbi:MAG TPA: hypothetical protein VMS99_17450 [Acidimicrobiia bacterium]|nr:hypothetical protein [Acidimicrobiia bacterium]